MRPRANTRRSLRVIWLHTFGERYVEPKARRPKGPPRISNGQPPRIPKDGAIPNDPACMPDEIGYDEARRRLLVGEGFVENVPPAARLTDWFRAPMSARQGPPITQEMA